MKAFVAKHKKTALWSLAALASGPILTGFTVLSAGFSVIDQQKPEERDFKSISKFLITRFVPGIAAAAIGAFYLALPAMHSLAGSSPQAAKAYSEMRDQARTAVLEGQPLPAHLSRTFTDGRGYWWGAEEKTVTMGFANPEKDGDCVALDISENGKAPRRSTACFSAKQGKWRDLQLSE